MVSVLLPFKRASLVLRFTGPAMVAWATSSSKPSGLFNQSPFFQGKCLPKRAQNTVIGSPSLLHVHVC